MPIGSYKPHAISVFVTWKTQKLPVIDVPYDHVAARLVDGLSFDPDCIGAGSEDVRNQHHSVDSVWSNNSVSVPGDMSNNLVGAEVNIWWNYFPGACT